MKYLMLLILSFVQFLAVSAQELNCAVRINHSQIQGTNTSVFTSLEKAIADFMNNRSWTDLQFTKDERINCSMNITVRRYVADNSAFSCELQYQVTRPVFNSTYNSVIFSRRDTQFDFSYQENQLMEFNENNIDNNLTAMLAYYAYLFIGMNLDTFSPKGGTDVLRRVENIVNSCQTMSEAGWKAFSDSKNRHAVINDYMESAMEPYRQMVYKYHREGLDEMASNVDRGRAAITESVELLKKAHDNKPLSSLPQFFTDFKRDELVNIYRGHGNAKEKDGVADILQAINASQSMEWKKIQR